MDMFHMVDRRGRFQYGLVTASQLGEAGASPRTVRLLAGEGVLVLVDRNVYRTVGAPSPWEQELLAACLAAGTRAVVSHRAAAALWDFVDPPAPIEITVAYGHRPLPRTAIRHRTRRFREVDLVVRHGIPVTSPARTLLDLAAVAPDSLPEAIERCLLHKRLTTAGLWRILDELGGPGRRGTRALRHALENRALGDEPPESLLEPLMAEVTVSTGVSFEYQFPVELDGRRYRLDFAVPRLRFACEVDGLSAHASRKALNDDLERQNRLVSHGWTVLRYTHTRLTRAPQAVRDEITATARQLQHGRSPSL